MDDGSVPAREKEEQPELERLKKECQRNVLMTVQVTEQAEQILQLQEENRRLREENQRLHEENRAQNRSTGRGNSAEKKEQAEKIGQLKDRIVYLENAVARLLQDVQQLRESGGPRSAPVREARMQLIRMFKTVMSRFHVSVPIGVGDEHGQQGCNESVPGEENVLPSSIGSMIWEQDGSN
uniref:Uncharacterized protein n=1 Tax=Globodera rostochiensis TaxID=31243 RepID=A0A914GZM8_GLORO